MRKLIFLVALLVLGCGGGNPGTRPEPVDISGRVTRAGRPITGVVLNLQPTKDGAQATLSVTNGEFKGQVTPGRYTYYFTEGKSAEFFQAIPETYRLGSMDRQLDVGKGGTLNITLD